MHELWNAMMMPIMLIYQLHRRRLSLSIAERGCHGVLFDVGDTNDIGSFIEELECAD